MHRSAILTSESAPHLSLHVLTTNDLVFVVDPHAADATQERGRDEGARVRVWGVRARGATDEWRNGGVNTEQRGPGRENGADGARAVEDPADAAGATVDPAFGGRRAAEGAGAGAGARGRCAPDGDGGAAVRAGGGACARAAGRARGRGARGAARRGRAHVLLPLDRGQPVRRHVRAPPQRRPAPAPPQPVLRRRRPRGHGAPARQQPPHRTRRSAPVVPGRRRAPGRRAQAPPRPPPPPTRQGPPCACTRRRGAGPHPQAHQRQGRPRRRAQPLGQGVGRFAPLNRRGRCTWLYRRAARAAETGRLSARGSGRAAGRPRGQGPRQRGRGAAGARDWREERAREPRPRGHPLVRGGVARRRRRRGVAGTRAHRARARRRRARVAHGLALVHRERRHEAPVRARRLHPRRQAHAAEPPPHDEHAQRPRRRHRHRQERPRLRLGAPLARPPDRRLRPRRVPRPTALRVRQGHRHRLRLRRAPHRVAAPGESLRERPRQTAVRQQQALSNQGGRQTHECALLRCPR